MPVNMFNHAAMNDAGHSGPPIIAGPGQFVYDQAFSQQMPNTSQPWFSPTSSHSAFAPQFLPAHQERKYSQYTS